jgi:hypothetical protein
MKQNQITLIIIGFILVALMATNPSTEEHKEAIKKEIFKAFENQKQYNESQSIALGNSYSESKINNIGEEFVKSIGGAIIDNMVERDNFILFSTVKSKSIPTVTNDIPTEILSFGIFGNVFMLKKYDVESKEFVDNIGVKTDSAASVTKTVVDDLFVFNNISELHSLFKYRDFNHAFVKKGKDYKISIFYVKEAGEDNSGNMYALKIEQQSEIVFVHIFEDNNNKLNILVEPNSGWTDKSQVQLYKTSNNSILIDYNILTNSQKYIKNKIEIGYNEISK